MERYDPKTDLEDHGKFVGMRPVEGGDWVKYTDAQRALDAEREKVKELEQEGMKLFEWRLALHSLTPGGSEFCTPEACESWVRKSRASQHEYIIEQIKQHKELQAQLTTLQAQLRQVEGERDALRLRIRAVDEEHEQLKKDRAAMVKPYMQLEADLATLRQLVEAFAKTTKGNFTLNRYEHGGGRMFADDGRNRDLIADTYNEGDREFIALCYEVCSALAAQDAGKGA